MKKREEQIAGIEEQSKIKFILKKLISEAGITDIELSRRLGIPNSTLSLLLNSDTVSPRVATLIPIATYFNITIDQLIGRQTSINPSNNPSKAKENKVKIPSEWNSEIYLNCLTSVCNIIKKTRIPVTAEAVINMVSEVYAYTLIKSKRKIDHNFVEWLVDHYPKK